MTTQKSTTTLHQSGNTRPSSGGIETPIFSKTYDLLLWLSPQALKFPRNQRFAACATLLHLSQEFHKRLLQAQRSSAPAKALLYADVTLAQLRLHWRLAHGWQLVSDGTFEHGVRLMDEVGRLLGAWLKNARAAAQRTNPAHSSDSSA